MGDQVLAEHDGLGNYVSHSVRAPSLGGIGGLLMTSSATPGTQNHQFPHYDAQGNLNGITNGGPYATAAGGPFLSRTYDAYGNITGEGQGGGQGVPAGKWGYSTKEEVAPGLLHYGERMYRPDIGRWISRDPIGEAGGVNLYGFVRNNPVNMVDPNGMWGVAFETPWGNVGSSDPWFLFGPRGGYSSAPAKGFYANRDPGDLIAAQHQNNTRNLTTFGAHATETGMGAYGQAANQLAWGSAAKGLGMVCAAAGNAGGAANTARRIAGGHAFEKHILKQGEFPGWIRTRAQLEQHVQDVMNAPTAVRQLGGGRTAYWHESTSTIVIHHPNAADLGTVFQPRAGRAYFDTIP